MMFFLGGTIVMTGHRDGVVQWLDAAARFRVGSTRGRDLGAADRSA
jgi:hypothetical protein